MVPCTVPSWIHWFEFPFMPIFRQTSRVVTMWYMNKTWQLVRRLCVHYNWSPFFRFSLLFYGIIFTFICHQVNTRFCVLSFKKNTSLFASCSVSLVFSIFRKVDLKDRFDVEKRCLKIVSKCKNWVCIGKTLFFNKMDLSLIHIWRCRRRG